MRFENDSEVGNAEETSNELSYKLKAICFRIRECIVTVNHGKQDAS